MTAVAVLALATGMAIAQDDCIPYREYEWTVPTARYQFRLGDSYRAAKARTQAIGFVFEEYRVDRTEAARVFADRVITLERHAEAREEKGLLEFVDDRLTGIAILLVPPVDGVSQGIVPQELIYPPADVENLKADYERFLRWRFGNVQSPTDLPAAIQDAYGEVISEYERALPDQNAMGYEIAESMGAQDQSYRFDLLLYQSRSRPDDGRLVIVRQSEVD